MASWMVHLRITDLLLDVFDNLEETEFVVGNIAPDSGIPSEDWSYYTPPSRISHFKGDDKHIHIEQYIEKYFTKELQKSYNTKQYSFYLGYLTHLMTDILWQEQIADACMEKHKEEVLEDRHKFVWKMKGDWYDLDFLYLSENPGLRAFEIYKSAKDFKNTYMDIFPESAFDNRIEYITGFYSEKRDNLNRDYPFLDKEYMDKFVMETTDSVYNWISKKLSL